MRQAPRRQAGFSLVELMVAVAVMGIVTSQLLVSFSQQHTSSLEHERTIEIQEEGRMVMDIILKDLRLAGFMVPKFVAVAGEDGGANGSDRLCVSDSSVIDDSTLVDASDKFAGAEITTPMTGDASSITVATSSLDIDGDGDNDFAVGSGVIIGTGTEGHCGRITAIGAGGGGTVITFTPSTGGTITATPSDAVVPAIVYTVTGNSLARNGVVLSDHIEDLQTEFGIDGDRSGTVGDDAAPSAEFPVDALDGDEYELLRNVRVHLTARELRSEDDFNGQYFAVANRVDAAATDNFKRRRITGDAILRNLR
jgi:prepilin-type N-terminal cleavage/methylation domain-containing protein